MKDIDFSRISSKLKELRIERNLTQEFVAQKADVNTSHICNIENNRVKVSLSTLVQICNALDVTVDYILSDEYTHPDSALEQEVLKELRLCSAENKEKILKIIKILQWWRDEGYLLSRLFYNVCSIIK